MAKKKKNSIVTYGDYQQNNGQVTTYGDYRQSQQKSEEKTSLTNPFQEKKKKEAQSILNNFLEDVKNRKHMPATYVKTKANQNGPSFRDLTSKDTFSGWMNANKPREVENRKGNHLDSYNEYLRKVRSGIEGGTFDEGDDYRLWSDDWLQKSIEEEQNKLASRKANPETEAQKQQKKEDLQGVKEQKGIYTYLDVNGLEDVKKKRTYRGKPDDYDEGNLSEEYNAMLYDAIHGEGSYAKRVDTLETDDQVDELDAEMEDYWDRLGKQKLHELGENREDLNARENELTDDLLYSEDKANKKIRDYQGVLQARKTVEDLEKENQDINSIGQYGAGNIDLYHRTPVIDSDGNIETVNSFSVNIDGKEILLPKVIDGKIVSEEEAIRHYEETGEHLGMFDTIEDANIYAENLHKQQERLYREDGKETQKSGSAVQELAKVVFGRPGEDEADRAYREIREQQAKSNSMTAAERNALFNQMAGNNFLPTGDELSNSLADTTKAYGQYYAFMSPAQVKTFKDFYESGDKDKAMAYLDGIKATGFLDAASNQYSQYMAEEAASGKHGWFYGLKSVAEAPIAGVMGLAGAGAALLGNEEAQKPDSVIYRPQAILSATRGARTEQWGEAAANILGEWARQPAKFLNNVFYSMADMAMAGAIGSGGGMSSKVCEPLVQFVMSSEAASATMNDQLQAGKDPTEAALYALGSGAIEWVTEKYSIEQILKSDVKELLGDKKQIAKFLLKDFTTEASEEASGKVLEIGLDAILSMAYGHENEIEERYNELIAQGMDPKNATGQVLWEKLQEIGTEALAGGLSGFFIGSARVGMTAIDQRNTGKTIKEAKTSGSKGQDVLVQTGLSMGEDTQSNKIAKEIQEKVDNGKEVSDRDVGRLAQNIQVESNENIGKAAQTVVEERAYDKLSGAEISVEEKREAARVIARAVAGEELSKKERAILTGNTAVFSVYKQFVTPGETSREAMGAIMDATQKDAEAAASVSELLNQRKAQETQEAEDPGEQLATEEDMTQATGTRTEGSRSVIVDGQWAKLGSLVADENGSLGWKVTIDGTEKTVKASQIRATDFSTAAIIRQAAVNPGMFSRWFTNDLIAANERGEIKNVGRFLLDAQKVRVAGYLGMQMPANTLGSAAQDLYDHAKQEHAMNRDAQLKGSNAGRQGKVTFMGAEYGTREWNQAIKSANLDSDQQAQIDAIAGIAQRAGIEVTFRDAAEVAKEMGVEDPEKYYGWENGSGISVNVEGLDFQLGEDGNPEVRGQHNMLVTFGHEMTHWLQRNSMQGYNSLESFVMGEMRRNGVNIQKRVMDVMENRELSIEDAMSEIVADACDQILGNEKVAQHIQETNQGLFKEIKHFVSDLVGRVKAAIKGMDQSASRDARAMMRSANNLAKVWMGAYDEAISGAVREGDAAQEANERFSMAQLDNEYMQAVKDENVQRQQELVRRAAEEAGYTLRGTHRTNAEFTVFDKSMRSGKNGKTLGDGFYIARGEGTEYDNDSYGKNRMVVYVNPGKVFNLTEGLTKRQANRIYDKYFAPFHEDKYNTYKPHVIEKLQSPIRLMDYIIEAAETNNTTTDEIFKWLGYDSIKDGPQYAVFDSEQIKSADPVTYDDKGKVIPLSERFNQENNDIRFSMAQLDAEYEEAVRAGELAHAEDMLLEKLQRTEGIIPFNAPHGYAGQHKDIARMIKNGTPEVVARAAEDMAQYVPDNAVLIPIPPHEGMVTDDTDTMILARAIGELTGRPVINALGSNERESRYQAKAENRKGVSAEEMGFRQIAEIPEGAMPIFIDNVVGSGETAKAARNALGGGITLSYAKSTRSQGIEGLKRATITYDKNGNLIPLSQRFDVSKRDVRFSEAEGTYVIENDDGDVLANVLSDDTIFINRFSQASWEETDKQKLTRILKKKGFTEKQIEKYYRDVNDIAAIILRDPDRLDYRAHRYQTMLKPNQEYIKTLDASTLCAKRLLYQGTFNEIQHMLPNTALMPEDLINLINMMKDEELVTPCSFCYVESRRRFLGKFAEEWLKGYKGEYIPTLDEVTTTDGLEKLRDEHEQTYQDFVDAMNKKGSNNPKVVQLRTDYRNEILKLTAKQVAKMKKIGGLRIQSFSDFEIPHLIDMMQAVIDMAGKGLTAQAYTKVPEFAAVFGNTGIKINLSLVGDGNGLDADGNLIFSSYEGMDFERAMELRRKYSKNVGTILVGMNDKHILAAMADPRIDFIIPFHKSGWSKTELAMVRNMDQYKDYTDTQNERRFVKRYKNGNIKYKNVKENFAPVEYWDFSKSGKENAEIYLRMCADDGRIPKFNQFLVDNGDGSYSLQPDGSTDGYWKTLIDYKMYDNSGKGSRQTEVQPNFNMTQAREILSQFDGTTNDLPAAHDIAVKFVEQYKAAHPEKTRFSKYTNDNMDVEEWMSKAKPWNLVTEDERELLDKYGGLRTRRGLLTKTVLELKSDIKRKESILDKLTPDELKDLERAKIKLEEKQQKLLETEDELFRVTSTEGYAGMMYRNNVVLNDWILGKTQDDVREAVEQMVDQVKASEQSIAAQVKALRKLADSQAVRAVSSMVEKKSLAYAVTSLKKQLNSDMGKTELESRLIEIALKKANGEDIQEDARLLAVDLTNKMRGYEIDTMERLRGITITIGPDQQAEMKGNGMTLQSVRDSLRGTGVKVRYGEYSSLDTDEEDLRTVLPELPQDIGENSADALFKFISWAQSMRDGDLAAKQSMVDIEEETTNVLAIASTIKVNMNSPEYRKQNEAAAKTRQAADELEQAGKAMSEQTELAGRRAIGFTSVLQRDVHQAIEYYNKVAKVAAQEEKNKVRKNLIEELKSENTRKLMEQRDKYEEMMKSDRRNRELAEDNMQIRNRINTIASRINKRLTAETDLKNIPQEAKPMARQVLKMLINHDMVYRHVLFADKKQRQATMQALNAYDMRDGLFNPDRDLNWLIVGEGDNADYDIYDKVCQDLIDIEQGLLNYRNAEGQKGVTLMDRREALRKIDDAVSEIWSVIRAREEANFNGKRMLISEMALQARDDMAKSRFKGEWTGVIGHGIGALRSGVIYGNMTPEYFFKNLKNKTISQLYDEYHRAENRNGLEVGRAQRRIAEIAEKYGYSAWDQEKRYTFKLVKGGTVNLTLGEMMSLYATWQREEANRAEVNGPEESFHLNVGGFYTVQEEKNKILGRELFEQKAHRMTEADMNAIKAQMTEEQLNYVRDIVEYITKDIGALGNEASMRMYGIKKYNEQWYFPFEIWEGVKSKKSDQGTTGNTENRTGHQSFTKRRVNNASNALVIRDFTETAVKHIAGMINYNTFAPAIEFMNRVMNTQLDEFGEGEDSNTKRNLRAIIGEIYGKDAVKYLDDFQKDVNGGVTRPDSTIYDKLLSTFKKSAVAGSMSVALQQPLSYIRAAMMVSPKYLATSINLGPRLKSIAEEMRKYSGVAVIKKMGKFDMNFGRSAQDYMMPDAKVSKGRAIYDKASDIATALPELMDTWTWCNMWEAVKKEQATMNPGVDQKSDEFLEKVAERFNDVMRKTQVYDSVLVKSRNMRNTNPIMKSLTSFMSEPTLTANVLYDAVINAKEKGGKTVLAKAATTFVMSAILQAIVKGLISAGRTPQDKKTWDENVAYRVNANLLNELNPMNLLPGYNDLIVLFKEGELSDDATSVVGKLLEAGKTTISVLQGKSENPWYRDLEDTAGVVSQLFTNIPAKNIMRDIRATINYIQAPWANRANSSDVLKYQLLDQIHTADNLTGVLNTWLGDKGWETKNASYYSRIYEADKAGKQEKANAMINYLQLARGTKETTINNAIKDLVKKDEKLSNSQKVKELRNKNMANSDISEWIMKRYKAKEITREEAEKLYKEVYPDKSKNDVFFTFDRQDFKEETGSEKTSGYYYRLKHAIDNNDVSGIRKAVKQLNQMGFDNEKIKGILKDYKKQYIAANAAERGKLQNRLIKAYNEVGVSSAEAMEIMQKWVLDASKSSK